MQTFMQGGFQGSLQRLSNKPGLKPVLNFWSIGLVTNIFQLIVTGDEAWVYHFKPESKRASIKWRYSTSPCTKKFKSQQSAGKVVVIVFWNADKLHVQRSNDQRRCKHRCVEKFESKDSLCQFWSALIM